MSPDSNPSSGTVVKQQVQAYNEGDIDKFASYYAENAVITSLDEAENLGEGRNEIYAHYGELFDSVPELTAEVVEEFTVGDYVVCKERMTGIDSTREALAVHLVQDSLIQHLWLGDSQ